VTEQDMSDDVEPQAPPASVTDRRSVVRGTAALGLTSLLLPASAAASSTVATTTYTTIEDGGALYVWGKAFEPRALGTGVSGDVLQPRLMTGGSPSFEAAEIVKALPAYWASIALAADGKMFGWGNKGTNGIATNTTTATATELTTWYSDDTLSVTIDAPTIVDFSPSQRAVVAVGNDGHVYAWGLQWGWEAGLPSNNIEYPAPRRVTGTLGLTATVGTADRIIQVAGNHTFMIWLDGEGRVRTSGTQTASGFGSARLGTGIGAKTSVTADVIAGSLVDTQSTADRIVQIAAGQEFGLALGRDGRIHAWGANASGQVGDGSTTQRQVPVVINGATESALPAANSAGRIIQVSAGAQHSLALGLDGRVYAWGSAANGRLGTGDTTPNRTVPVDITGFGALPAANAGNRIVQVAAANTSSYALGADGTVYSWGQGEGGRLGNGATADETSPIRIWDQGAFAPLAPFATGTQRRIMFLGVHRGSDESAHIFAIDNVSVV
jgi:alpha-tubulin suppressor-like RCC1 family protein